MKISAKEHDEAIATLLKFLKPKDKVYCNLRHVSKSGMQRRISFYCISHDEKDVATGHKPALFALDWYIQNALGYRRHDQGGLVVDGCGMDMGFNVVYNLGAALWPKGTPEPHGRLNGEPDSTGGYALKHEWI